MNYQNIFAPIKPLKTAIIEPGGLCWIKFCKWEDILLFPQVDPLTGLATTSFTLKAGASWMDIIMPDKDRMFTESQADGTAGDFYRTDIRGYVAGNSSDHVLTIAAMKFHQYVVIFSDRGGQVRFVGDQDSGAEFSNNYSSGDKDSSRKRTVNFLWAHPGPLPIYAGSLDGILNFKKLPTSNAGIDKTITLPTSSVTLAGSGTADAGETLTYKWAQVSGPSTAIIASSTSSTTDITSLVVAGIYIFSLKVSTTDGRSSSDSAQVTVLAAIQVNIYDTTLTFVTSTTDLQAFVHGKVLMVSNYIKLHFNKLPAISGLPMNMKIKVYGIEKMSVDFYSDYLGRPFEFRNQTVIKYTGVFTDGIINFT